MTATPPNPTPPPRRGLRREICWVLAFKAVALAALYLLFFSANHRPPVSAEAVAALFAGSAPTQGKP